MKACGGITKLSLIVFVMNILIFQPGSAAWQVNGSVVCDAPTSQYCPETVSDMAGGAIITWWDFDCGHSDIRIQRVDSSESMQTEICCGQRTVCQSA